MRRHHNTQPGKQRTGRRRPQAYGTPPKANIYIYIYKRQTNVHKQRQEEAKDTKA